MLDVDIFYTLIQAKVVNNTVAIIKRLSKILHINNLPLGKIIMVKQPL